MNLNLRSVSMWFRSLSPFRYTAEKCGHRTKRTGERHAFGEARVTQMPLNENGTVDYCLDCIGKMAIRCAWCGEAIFIGDFVTLYTPMHDFKVPDHAVVYKNHPLQLVGCLGWNCANSGGDRAGFWVPGENGVGCVLRVPTPLELLLSASDSVIVVSDLSDIHEAISPRLVPRLKRDDQKDHTVH